MQNNIEKYLKFLDKEVPEKYHPLSMLQIYKTKLRRN